ncbi:MAG TPA: EAL domain-containing protein [Rectinemataceae bacterium]|nr:EAL domain-containing protein [Rectinemataceae bacterium]
MKKGKETNTAAGERPGAVFGGIAGASLDGLLIVDRNARIREVNDAYCAMTGYKRDELLGMGMASLEAADGANSLRGRMHELETAGRVRYPSSHRRRDGTIVHVEVGASRQPLDGGAGYVMFVRDLRRREDEVWRDLTRNALLELYALRATMKEYLDSVVDLLASWSGCSCVGIRLIRENGDIPFSSYVGFDPEFIKDEGWVSLHTDQCICSRMANGLPGKREREHLTEEGAFFCNDTVKFMEGLGEEERSFYRGDCARKGYRSMAVIPLCYQERILGVVDLADEREGAVPPQTVSFVQTIAPIVGEAVYRFSMEAELKDQFDSQKIINSILRLTIDNLSLDEILDRSLEYMLAMPWLSGESSGCILLVDGRSGRLRLRAQHGLTERARETCGGGGQDDLPCFGAADGKEIRFVSREDGTPDSICIDEGIIGQYSVPIISSGTLLGLLLINLKSKHRPRKTIELYLSSIATTLSGIILRKYRERELQAERNKLASILETMNDGVIISGKDGAVEYINPVMERIYGPPDGKSYAEYLQQELGPDAPYANPETGEFPARRFELRSEKKGRTYDVYSTATADGGSVDSRIDFFHDITDLKRSAVEIKKQADLLARVNDAIISFDKNFNITYWNFAAEAIYGWKAEEVAGRSVIELLRPRAIGETIEELDITPLLHGYHREMVHQRMDGTDVPIEASTIELYDEQGGLAGYVTVNRDITRRKMDEEEMKKLSLAVEQTTDWVFITNREGIIEYSNNSAESITGYTKKEIIGRKPSIIKSGKHDQSFYKALWDTVIAGKTFRSIFINRKKNGELFYLDNSITPLVDGSGTVTHFVASGRDITQQKRMEDQLVSLVHYDMLTGLPNRTLFMERLSIAMSRAEYQDRLIAALVIDLDKFKLLNDTFGPEVGDEILKAMATRLGGAIREGDIVARLGGDEFGLALVDVAQKEDFIIIVEKIRAMISMPMSIQGHDIVTTASIGISIYPYDGTSAFAIMHNADIAFSRLKVLGSNNYQFYTADMNLKASEFIFIEQQLFSTVNNGNKDFVINYQPYYDINTRAMVGMEALLRWDTNGGGLIMPETFIPILEETGMINSVGTWIIQSVCRQVREWHDRGFPVVPVSINLSPAQFRQKDLFSIIERTLAEYGIDPSVLVFELTENMLMHDLEYTSSQLRKFRALGLSISVDDFGMGYSSLSYLKRFPINNIKIDKSFVKDINTDPDSGSIVTAIISISHSLNLKAIAEGVETEEQFNILRILRCDTIQGFYLSRPVPAESIEAMYRELAVRETGAADMPAGTA